jgi:hypothetical protein
MDEDEEHDRAQREHAGRGVAIPIAAERCFLYPDPGRNRVVVKLVIGHAGPLSRGSEENLSDRRNVVCENGHVRRSAERPD